MPRLARLFSFVFYAVVLAYPQLEVRHKVRFKAGDHSSHGLKVHQRVNDRAIQSQLLRRQEKTLQQRREMKFNATRANRVPHVKKPRREWSGYEGVTVELLEAARNRTLRHVQTSCAALVREHFPAGSAPEPMRYSTAGGYDSSLPEVQTGERMRTIMFLHIPKNAGTSIERATMSADAIHFSKHLKMFAEQWVLARRGFQDEKGRVHVGSSVSITVPVDAGTFHPAGAGTCKCSYWHIPPRYLENAGAGSGAGGWSASATNPRGEATRVVNAYRGAEVYCVVRDPLERALSEFKMRHASLLDSKGDAQAFLIDLAARLKSKKICRSDCHVLPQYEYIWNGGGNRTCHHVLRIDSLKASFDALMRSKGKPEIRLPARPRFTHHGGGGNVSSGGGGGGTGPGGEVTASDIEPEIARIIRCAYAVDACLLGFPTDETGTVPSPGAASPGAEAGNLLRSTGCVERPDETAAEARARTGFRLAPFRAEPRKSKRREHLKTIGGSDEEYE
mmetsp:Transcript_48663/g.110455  ORF Transcript_48663/g.110455 Transcript_48663/m.110455 type:complete len:505 (-) Transcript_48663:151-1665(-)|eukprot:CAMPEP_0172590146 /NCGR_PEP_ID=MMETSP1068-20121228/8579_1 /TAXON_ID=35684 /ORGANISM="Pseudopedinella elastica, Strain CCMP716" /LENGTH=504 /DNA_ID=CAMNT_0013385847 /DNA_START=278 /DNA_END=1792 /DNA_ORIENTATION=-